MDEEERVPETSEANQPTYFEKKRMQNQQNAENNEKNIRAAASILKDKNIPYVSAIAAAVDTADKISGGRTTRKLGKDINRINKVAPKGRQIQRMSNRLGESGAADMANNISNMKKSQNGGNTQNKNSNNTNKGMANKPKSSASKNSNSTNNSQTTHGEIKQEISKIIKSIAIFALPLFPVILIIMVILGYDQSADAAGAGSYLYGETCPIITVENSGCDANGNNCSLIYDGEVELEDYVAGVVAAETEIPGNLEYYKLSAINARTYVLENIDDDCTVEGNNNFLNYVNVEESPNKQLIEEAVKETRHKVTVKDDNLLDSSELQITVANEDNENYYIEYNSKNYEQPKTKVIPKQWAENNSNFSETLSNAYSQQVSNDENSKTISNIVSYYLITEENYSYQSVLEYNYGTEIETVTNEMQLSGIEGFINPTRRIHCTSPFGPRTHPVKGTASNHGGLDIGIGGDQPIYAANSGTVRTVVNNVTAINNCNYGYGNYIIIDHENGVSTLYAHMKYGTIPDSITVGSRVRQGTQIGLIGSTGCSTGPHLHYEVRENNIQVDPTKYINLTDATGTCKR